MKKNRSVGIFGVLAISVFFSGCKHELSQAPPEVDPAPLAHPDSTSFVTVDVSLPYSEIQSQVNKLFSQFSGSYGGSVHLTTLTFGKSIAGVNLVLKTVSVDANWGATISSDGQILVTENGDKLHFHVPIKVNPAWAGLNGDIANLTSVSRKNFSGSFSVEADASVSLSPDYQPVIAIQNVDVIWRTEPNLEVLGRVGVSAAGINLGIGPYYVNVANLVHDSLRDAIRGKLQEAAAKIQTDTIKTSLAAYWKAYSIPISLTKKSKVYINLSPTNIAASSLIASPDRVRWVGRIGFNVAISDIPSKPIIFGLPPLGVLTDQAGLCEINLPIQLSYDFLSNTATEAVMEQPPIPVHVPIGQGEIAVKKIDVYPMKDSLVLGVTFSAKLPSKLLSTDGVFWLTGKPHLGSDGHSFSIQQLAIYDKLENPLWTAGVEIAYPMMLAAVTKATNIDFQPSLNKATEKVVSSLQGLKDPIHCSVKNAKVEVIGLGLDADGLQLDSRFKGTVSFVYHH